MQVNEQSHSTKLQDIKVVIIGQGTMGNGIKKFLIINDVPVEICSAGEFLSNSAQFVNQLNSCNLIIECAAEDLGVKSEILSKLSRLNKKAIIGSCTSSLSISELQEFVNHPGRFCGIHFMNPPTSISTIELIPGQKTFPETLSEIKSFLENLGRIVFQVHDYPGFVVNSILLSMLNQAVYTLESCGLSHEELDQIMKKTTGAKMGPLATLDLIGIDVAISIIENLNKRDPSTFTKPAKTLYKMLKDDYLGRKTGQGFFIY